MMIHLVSPLIVAPVWAVALPSVWLGSRMLLPPNDNAPMRRKENFANFRSFCTWLSLVRPNWYPAGASPWLAGPLTRPFRFDEPVRPSDC